jgi:hypothetical protein
MSPFIRPVGGHEAGLALIQKGWNKLLKILLNSTQQTADQELDHSKAILWLDLLRKIYSALKPFGCTICSGARLMFVGVKRQYIHANSSGEIHGS